MIGLKLILVFCAFVCFAKETVETDTNLFSQIIDENGLYSALYAECVRDFIMKNPSFSGEWGVVAIIGAQSSGKSTLLNALFETEFAVMNGQLGWQRTTSGVWAANAHPPAEYVNSSKSLLIMDVEGVDSYERNMKEGVEGEEARSYENRVSLFSLALADVLIVNMAEADIGRLSAAGVPLLEKVINATVKMDLQKGKTTLLFVLQGYNEVTPIPLLQQKVERILADIWKRIEKPQNKNNLHLDDFFLIKVTALPNIVPRGVLNRTLVADLKQWFFNPHHKDYLFCSSCGKQYTDLVEVERLGKQLWTLILQDKDLDVESTRRLVSRARCHEALEEAQQNARAVKQMLVAKMEAGTESGSKKEDNKEGEEEEATMVTDLRANMQAEMTDIMKAFVKKAARHDREIYEESRGKLKESLDDEYEAVQTHYFSLVKQRKVQAEKKKAEKRERQAQQEKAEAEERAEKARREKAEAEEKEKKAQQQRREAEEKEITARREKAVAEENEKIAQQAKKDAEIAAREAAIEAQHKIEMANQREAFARREAERARNDRDNELCLGPFCIRL